MYRTLQVAAAIVGFACACSGAQNSETLSATQNAAEQNAATQNAAAQAGEESNAAQPNRETAMDEPATDKGGVANLPYARGKVFHTLDEYLAHLHKQSAIDLPYWREIQPGVYEHMKSMRGAEREVATREELMQRFGFER